MKRFTIILVAAILATVVVPASAATPNPFNGNWKGFDPFDGSNVTYWIVEEAHSGGKVFDVRGSDDRTGRWCGGGPATLKAVGVLEAENYLVLSLVWTCLAPGNNVLYFLSDNFTYDPTTQTFTDSLGATFRRER